jgi:hypothetical protein
MKKVTLSGFYGIMLGVSFYPTYHITPTKSVRFILIFVDIKVVGRFNTIGTIDILVAFFFAVLTLLYYGHLCNNITLPQYIK